MNTPSTRAVAALTLAALAGAAAAQTPSVEYHLIASGYHPDLAFSLPQGLSPNHVIPAGPGRTLITSTNARMFIADGQTLTEICRAGTQIPGQPAGSLWRGSMPLGHAFYVEGRGLAFLAAVTLPGLGNVTRVAVGDPTTPDPIALGDAANLSNFSRCTRTGLVAFSPGAGEVRIGPAEGPRTTVVPANFIPPGFSNPISSWGATGLLPLNRAGVAAGVGVVPGEGLVAAIIDANGFHAVAALNQTIHTDRGDFTIGGNIIALSQPMDDGSAIWYGYINPDVQILWTAGPGGDGPIFALGGDPAPGCPAGYTITSPNILAVTGNGLVLWAANLRSNGASAGSVLYLRKSGRDRLILRSGTPVAGAPDGAVVPFFSVAPNSFFDACYQLNSRGQVSAILAQAGAVYLYDPEAGTVEAVRRQQTLPIAPLTGVVRSIIPAYGSFSGVSFNSGGDDDRDDLLDDDGGIYFAGAGDGYRAGGLPEAFSAVARITSPGCRPDYNADGFLDFFDYIAFVDCFEGVGGCPNGKDADFNNDDFADFFDVIDYIDAFERGC